MTEPASDIAGRHAEAVLSGGHFWERTATGWHLVFYALLAIAAGLAATDSDASPAALPAVLLVLAVWGVWYQLTWRRWWTGDRQALGLLYIAGMVPLVLTSLSILPSTSVMLFAAIAQVFATIRRLHYALGVVVIIFAGFGLSLYARGSGLGVFVGLGFSALFSAVLGAWIGGIIRQSEQRADLIAALSQTRDELADVSHERGMLAERERLSRDIHDTLAQGFTSIVMLLEAADAEIGTDDEAARRHLALAGSTARENLAEARSLVAALSPAGLADGSLVEAIGRLVDRCGEELQLCAKLTVTGAPRRLPSATEVVLLRAAQESLANVRKHAGAQRLDVHLGYAAETTMLRVRDDGSGFDPTAAVGFGLHGMRARAHEVGGCLRVDSAPGAGTSVDVEVPL